VTAVARPATVRTLLARSAVDVSPLRTSGAFRRLWAGQAVAFLTWRMLLVAVPVQVYELTGSTLAVGLVALTQFVPLVTLAVLGGAVADTIDRRRLLLWSSVGVALSVAGLTANALVSGPELWAVFLLSLLSWSAYALGAGAMRSLTARLLPVEQLAPAAALNGLYSNLGSIVGPAIAGVLIQQIGFGATYGIGLAGALIGLWSIVALPALPPLEARAGVSLGSLADGFRYLGTQRVVLAFFLIDTVAMIFGMPMALFPALAEQTFGNPAAVGYLYAAPAVGALVASLLSGWAGHTRRQGIAIVVAASAWGVAIAGFGFASTLWLGLLLLALAGAADQISAIFRSTIVLTVTPDHLRGRLGGIEFAQVASAPALGNLEAGIVASLTSLRFSIVSGGIVCVVGTLLLALAFPRLIAYDARAAVAARGSPAE
jgi:MFS family permease